jgi:hypothetical protein
MPITVMRVLAAAIRLDRDKPSDDGYGRSQHVVTIRLVRPVVGRA